MNYRKASLVGSVMFFACFGLASCGNNDGPANFGGSGGAGTSGAAGVGTGGSGPGVSGGASATGGASNTAQGGAAATGGQSTSTGGASSQGGAATGGAATGGANQGGTSATGGSTVVGTGGSAVGGAATGGVSNQGGAATGGAAAGGAAAGGSSVAGADSNGKCGLLWAAGGASGKPALDATVTPTVDSGGDKYTFAFGRSRLVVSAKNAGNIMEFSVDGNNIIEPTYGSTFCPSPQSAYTMWPPPAELSSNPYTASVTSNILSLVGAATTTMTNGNNLSFNKRFWVNEASGVVTLEYTIINRATGSATWAPWEITRVPAGGYTFAPKGPGTRTFTLAGTWETAMPLTLTNGINWLDYPGIQATMTQSNYIVEFDGAEGWLAHAHRIGTATPLNLLLVKSFPDAKDSAMPTNQGEIQLWANGSGDTSTKRIEVEEQGEQKTLAANEKLVWTAHWALCELPTTATLAAGNADLVMFARAHAVAP